MTEHQNLEWKETWRDEYLRWICGFANAQGGTLVIGKSDRGGVVGVKEVKKLLEDLPNKVRDTLGIMVDVNRKREAGVDLVEIVVEPYPTPISYKGEYHYRSGSTKQELKGAALNKFLMRKYGQHWDGVPNPYARLKELSKSAIDGFRKLAAESKRLPPEVRKEAVPALMERLHLQEGTYLKRAAVLLFHPEPDRYVTGAYVKIGFFRTNTDLLYQDEIHGDLFTQVEKTLDLLLTKYLRAGISYKGLQRIEAYPVPESALREAVTNALIHKDYGSGNPIQISVYDDKLMMWNAGELPPHWTEASFKGKHNSHPFNPDVANAFFRAGQIEAWGRGIERIYQACRSEGMPKPALRFEPTGLWVVFKYPREAVALAAAATAAGLSDQVTDLVADPVGALVAVIGTETLAPAAIRARLQLKHRPTFRANYLHPALEQGVVEMTAPETPNSRLQKYRLTAKGKALLAANRKQ